MNEQKNERNGKMNDQLNMNELPRIREQQMNECKQNILNDIYEQNMMK